MSYIKDSIYNTGLPIKVIDEKDLSIFVNKYPQLGNGEEGLVFRYDRKTAIKVFECFEEREKLKNKFAKIEELARLKDENFCFPKGLVGYLNLKKEGYFMDLVNPNPGCYDFSRLDRLKDMKKVLEYIITADKAIQRIHKKGLILGDIRDDHILIDKSNTIKFVDTDNYMYLDYYYDLVPGRASWLYHTYGKKPSAVDNDIFVFTIMALQHIVSGTIIKMQRNDNYFKELINSLDVNKEVKEGLRLILSDAEDKPYLGKVLKKISENELSTRKNLENLNFIK